MNPYIELYRGIAALMVMACHNAFILTGGERSWLNFLWTGVDFFFVISGFVFAPHISRGKIAILGFFVRRFFRIYPLYFLSVWLYFALTPDVPEKIGYLLNHLGMLHTIHSRAEAFFFNSAYWTLPPEVEFYLLLPLLALWVNSSRKLVMLISLALAMHIALYDNAQINSSELIDILSVHLPGLLIEFLVGVLAFRFSQRQPMPFVYAVLLLVISAGMLVWLGQYFVRFGGAGIYDNPVLRTSFNLLCALAYAIILCVTVNLAAGRIPNGKWVALSMLAGQSSYGVYLFHYAIPVMFVGMSISPMQRFVLYGFVTVLLAIALNRFYEGPLHRYGVALSNRVGKMQNRNT